MCQWRGARGSPGPKGTPKGRKLASLASASARVAQLPSTQGSSS